MECNVQNQCIEGSTQGAKACSPQLPCGLPPIGQTSLCPRVQGPGSNACPTPEETCTGSSSNPSSPSSGSSSSQITHLECRDSACVPIPGSGENKGEPALGCGFRACKVQ